MKRRVRDELANNMRLHHRAPFYSMQCNAMQHGAIRRDGAAQVQWPVFRISCPGLLPSLRS